VEKKAFMLSMPDQFSDNQAVDRFQKARQTPFKAIRGRALKAILTDLPLTFSSD
jgi:hypothetical protein